MYAVIRTGGKQHRIEKGERIRVEKLDAEVGAKLKIDDVLMIGGNDEPKIGRPRVDGATVSVTIIAQGRGEKIRVFKRAKRKGFHKTIGHRQPYTEIEITGIQG